MSIGFSPFTPTSTDRNEDPRTRNPKQPEPDKRKAVEAEDKPAPDEEQVDAIERAVPPVSPTH